MDPVPWQTVTNCLQIVDGNPITYENAFPPRKQEFLLQRQVKYVGSIIVTRDTTNLGVSSWELIQTISDIRQASSYVQADNDLYWLIQKKRMPNLKRRGQVIKYQEKLQNGCIFVCHSSTVGTWWLMWSGRIFDGQTHLVIFLLILIITFNWIWMKPASFVMRMTYSLLGAKINPAMKKKGVTPGFQ